MDMVFLVILGVLLLWQNKKLAFCFGIFGGISYFLVDWGIFYKLLGTRVVEGADPVLFLLWLSISYGFTNFVWIWLWLDKDKHLFEWSLFIITGWMMSALMGLNFGTHFTSISISRNTIAYHGIMALLLFIGYGVLIYLNMKNTHMEKKKINIPWILAIGILVQFSWEAVLLISGIREFSIIPLIVNSLIETNMGLPYIFFIHRYITKRYTNDFGNSIL
jgi:hypothetical protein